MSATKPNKMKKLLAERIQKNRKRLWDWHVEHARKAPPPFYCSVDLRDSGFKIAPVDSNLYPAGFNNICPDDIRAASPSARAQLEGIASRLGLETPKRILVLPEAHTSNAHYFENLHYLTHILKEAGFETRIGWFGPAPEGREFPLKLVSATGKELEAHSTTISGGQLSSEGFVPDLILLNNDFSSGYPKELDEVKQPILPSHVLGWHSRKKSEHFVHYNRLAAEFAAIIDIDPWIIQIDSEGVEPVNFNDDVGTAKVADVAEAMLHRIEDAYRRNQVEHKPFVFIKNNAGTYGMGIMVAHSAEELRAMNRRTKNKMSVGKGRMQIESVVVQEGIPTATLVDRLAAEPVIYLMGCELIGGFLRTNTEKGVEENLNSQGMVFKKLCMSDLRNPYVEGREPDAFDEADAEPSDEPVLELVYGSIARISALATGFELADHLSRNRS